MAVIIREERAIAGKKQKVLVYKTIQGHFLTKDEREKAEQLDDFLSKKLKKLTQEIKKLDLLRLKNREGVIKLWYEVGRRLAFVMDTNIISVEDREFVFRALYDHAGILSPGAPNSRTEGKRNHFLYCYKVSIFPWEFINTTGNWSAWVEFMDSEKIREDGRIIDWLHVKSKEKLVGFDRNWLRKLTKAIRQTFKNKDTLAGYSNEELKLELDRIFDNIIQAQDS